MSGHLYSVSFLEAQTILDSPSALAVHVGHLYLLSSPKVSHAKNASRQSCERKNRTQRILSSRWFDIDIDHWNNAALSGDKMCTR